MEKELIKKLFVSYLKLLTAIKLHFRFKGQIIGLAGCYGKSSAVDMIKSLLSQNNTVFTTNVDGKGLNSETGVPFAILGVHPDGYSALDWLKYLFQGTFGLFKKLNYDYLVLELGVDKPNDMRFLTSFIKPHVGIIINSNNTHSANFEELQVETKLTFEELISNENGYLFEESRDAILYNLDDPEVIRQIGRFMGENKIPFSAVNNPSIKRFEATLDGTTEIEFGYINETATAKAPASLLEEYRNTIEMIIKLAQYYKLQKEAVIGALENYKLPPGRCTLFKGVHDTYLIDSSYNSSYLPANSALKLLNYLSSLNKSFPTARRIAILGDMRELGILSEKEHRKLASDAVKNTDIVITVGPLMKQYFNDEFVQNKREVQQIFSFETTKEALELVTKNENEFLKQGDIILIKGSQNTLLLEIIVEKLLKNSENVNKLCRRGEFYEKKRQELIN